MTAPSTPYPQARGTAPDEQTPSLDGDAAAAIPYELIELFFFAYRDFVAGPDRILTEFAFGRAHHRVLHFVDRNPGLTIAELLDILQITKQSLNRVLKELVETGFVQSRTGQDDRRQRHLQTTAKGHELATRLASLQAQRIAQALAGIGEAEIAVIRRYLTGLIEAPDRAKVAGMVAKGGQT
jgi:DNA-binding MarR family transcriptional regulator